MSFASSGEEGDEVVRSFMLTRGRTRASATELPLETLVSSAQLRPQEARRLTPDEQRITALATTPTSLAEISALLELPLRTVIVMGSEMVAAGSLVAESTVEVVDTAFLNKIKSAFESL